tara:strand:+ start:104 stop:1138 length:1035 start_codon:yes stop_codon:yes gene_type:complete
MFNFIKIILKPLIIFIYSRVIIISLFYFQTIRKKKLVYSNSLGFGDNITFFIKNYLYVKKKNHYVFKFSDQVDQTLDFFFSNKKILKSILRIPYIFYYPVINEIKKSKQFKKFYNDIEWENMLSRKNNDSQKNLIDLKLIGKKSSNTIYKFIEKKERYLCFFWKFNRNKNDIHGSNARATFNKEKIFKLLNYLIHKKKLRVIILGLKNDPSIKILRKFQLENNLESRLSFLIDISNNYSFIDQVLIAKNSLCYIGNGSGITELFYHLKIKALIFDHTLINYFRLPHFKKYRKTLFKKYKLIDKTENILSEKNTDWLIKNKKTKYEIIENTFEDIVYEFENYPLN